MKTRPQPQAPSTVPAGARPLRRRAEHALATCPNAVAPFSAQTDALARAQELHNHKIESELRNKELQQTKSEIQREQAKLTELYDCSPVGYFTLDPKGLILEVNLAGAALLRVDRSLLVGRRFPFFVALADRESFVAFLAHALAQPKKHGCELALQSPGRALFRAELHAIWSASESEEPVSCRIVVTDVTDRHRADEARKCVDVLAAANQRLSAEVADLRAAEAVLKQSASETRALLSQAAALQKKLRLATHRVLLVQEEQRKKLSRELHDEISQLLVGIVVNLGNLTKTAERDPASIVREIPPLRLLVERSVRAVRDFARELRPAMLDDIGLVAALETYIADFPKAKGRKITFTADPAADHLDNVRRTALFRIAQESLINAHKHARAHRITVHLTKTDGFVTLEIADDGCAFEVEPMSSPGANQLGLIGMRERVEMLGGHLEIASAPGTGTRVSASVPSGRTRRALR